MNQFKSMNEARATSAANTTYESVFQQFSPHQVPDQKQLASRSLKFSSSWLQGHF